MREQKRIEFKFAEDSPAGVISGYGSIFGNVDSYGDVVEKGAFKETLREWEDKGKYPPMLLQHGGGFFGGDAMSGVPIGVWTSMEENNKGLKVEGKLLAMETDDAKRVYEAVKAGALDGLSIGYEAREFTNGTKPGEPRRKLTNIDLWELSIVTFPANGRARISDVKAASEDLRKAVRWLGEAIDIHAGHMDGSIDTSEESQSEMMDLMKRAHGAMTDRKTPGGMSGMKTIREFEDFLRDVGGFSHTAAKAIAARGFKSSPRDEAGDDHAGMSGLLDTIRSTRTRVF